MLLKTRDGIICDLCGTIYKDQFSYYSVEASKIQVVNNMKVNASSAKFNRDICSGCYQGMLEQCQKFIRPFRHKTVKCDFSERFLTGTFNYYMLVFSAVIVDKNLPEDQQVQSESKIMDFNLSQPAFQELLERSEIIRKKLQTQKEWS